MVAVDEGMMRRLKALAITAPLHDLDARKNRLDFADASVYQMAEVGFHVIDQVTLAMDFDRGANHEQVIARTVPFVASQAPMRGAPEHKRVARWVLDNLINVGTQDRGFTTAYGAVNTDGVYEKRTWSFKLLVELNSPDGEVYLRSTDEAINVLVGALDTDVESAQEAAEVKLANLIERGRLSDAQAVADQARLRTIQYAERLRVKLDATRRDVTSVDWLKEVPDLVNEAITHIEGRFRAESAILEHITKARDDAVDAVAKRKAADLVQVVEECLRRHRQLEMRLITAGQTFRSEQDRQQLSGEAQRATVDLFGQLLTPTLGLSLAGALAPTSVFFRSSVGLSVPSAPRLMDVVYLLLTPPAERDDLVGEVPEPDLVDAREPDRFSDDQWAEADRLLMVDAVPRRLSGLLAEARDLDLELPHLIAMRVYHAIDPEIIAVAQHGESHVLIAVDDGTPLHDPEFGGADLLVAVAGLDRTVTADQETDMAADEEDGEEEPVEMTGESA